MKIKSKSNSGFIGLLVLLIAVIGVGAVVVVKTGVLQIQVTPSIPLQKKSQTQTVSAPTPTPTATYLKPGKETYVYSWGEGTTVPKMNQVDIEPHDPKKGQKQTVTVKYTHTSPIQQVSLQLFSDNKSETFPMTKSEGTDTNGTWTGTWTVNDTVLYRYDLRLLVKADGKEVPYDVVLRGDKP